MTHLSTFILSIIVGLLLISLGLQTMDSIYNPGYESEPNVHTESN